MELQPELARRLQDAFARGAGEGLLQLGAAEVGLTLPPVFSYWRELGTRYVTAVCTQPEVEAHGATRHVPIPATGQFEQLAAAAPLMPGSEYLTADVLRSLWEELDAAFCAALSTAAVPLQEFLGRLNPAWNLVGRVHFNLAENRRDEDAPFAFLATYTTRLSAHGKAQHLPLGQALREYAGAANKQRLLSLLLPVQRAAERCAWLRAMVDAGEIFHPLRWTPQGGLRLLTDVPLLEPSGVVVRMPATWRAGRPSRPQATATVGGTKPAGLGKDALLDFHMEVTLDGERLTAREIRDLLSCSDGLALIRGHWVEVDRERLGRMMEKFRQVEQLRPSDGLTFAEAMRLLAGANVVADGAGDGTDQDWSRVVAGPWLAETLKALRSPEGLARVEFGPRPARDVAAVPAGRRALAAPALSARPRRVPGRRHGPRQNHPGAGAAARPACGRGSRTTPEPARRPRLAAGQLGRRDRALRAAPHGLVAHPSAMPAAELKAFQPEQLDRADLVITSYGTLLRLPWLSGTRWHLVVLDEAQAIKNPDAKQTRAVKRLEARARIALTGTPIENRLGDLWSIFDFINPGLLGSAKQFTAYTKSLADQPHNPYGPLRELVRPYILRRLKTDKSVIADLPDKTEVKAYCPLSRKQAALYQQAVKELAERLEDTDGIERRGLVLALLMRFKQICNHPSQWLGDGAWAEADSGKLARLREIAEVVAAKQEKVLVFTQFREVTAPLAAFLGEVFGRAGLVLHGETPVKQRTELVRQFQEDESVPFFVLSLKAGGAGLNLTAASHVVHFDRWWNPAVENQATDRAFRIGQTKNVLVHKFVCRGTVEEKIDELIESKRQLSQDLLEGGAELQLTELNDDELLNLVRLDLQHRDEGVTYAFRVETLRAGGRAPAAGGARDGEAQKEGAPRRTGRDRGPHHRAHVLGQGLVREPRALQRLRQPAASRADLCAQRLGGRPARSLPAWSRPRSAVRTCTASR